MGETRGRELLTGLRDAAVLFVVGAVFAGAPFLPRLVSRPYPDGITAPGTVARLEDSPDEDSCYALVDYEAAGRSWQVRSSYGSSDLCGLQGAIVDVSYPPDRPGEGRVIVNHLSAFALLFSAIGVLAMGAAVVKIGLTVRDALRWRRTLAPLKPLVPPWAEEGATVAGRRRPRITGRGSARRRGADSRPGRRDRP
jgi:hypothetical protein